MSNKTISANIRPPGMKAKSARRQGYIPGVIYAKGQQTTPIIVEGKSLRRLLREQGQNVFFEFAIENEMKPVRLREIQRDPVTKDVIHVDAQVINTDQRIRVDVPIRIEGSSYTDQKGITIQRQKQSIRVEGLVEQIPTHINVLVHGLEQGGNIRIGDLEISEELSILDSKDEIVLSAVKNSSLDTQEIDLEEEIEESMKEGLESQNTEE